MSVNDWRLAKNPSARQVSGSFSGKKGNIVFNIVKMHEQKNIVAAALEIIWLIVGQVEKTAKGNVAHFLQTDTS